MLFSLSSAPPANPPLTLCPSPYPRLLIASSWSRGKAQASTEQDLEAGNDDQLNQLHSKISQIRGVTQDIYSDSRTQNSLLDGTSNAFDSFKTALSNTSSRFTRVVQNRQGQVNYTLVIPAAVVVLFFTYKLLFSGRGGADVAPPVSAPGQGEALRW
ncbi:hypothetical protein JCM10207_004160 [Rhodosporidiobolus poonsookiae]